MSIRQKSTRGVVSICLLKGGLRPVQWSIAASSELSDGTLQRECSSIEKRLNSLSNTLLFDVNLNARCDASFTRASRLRKTQLDLLGSRLGAFSLLHLRHLTRNLAIAKMYDSYPPGRQYSAPPPRYASQSPFHSQLGRVLSPSPPPQPPTQRYDDPYRRLAPSPNGVANISRSYSRGYPDSYYPQHRDEGPQFWRAEVRA